MTILSCSKCGARLRAKVEAAGMTLPCPRCQHPLRLPDQLCDVQPRLAAVTSVCSARVVSLPEKAEDITSAIQPARTLFIRDVVASEDVILLPCPRCGKRLRAGRSEAGQRRRCPTCGQLIAVPRLPDSTAAAIPQVPPAFPMVNEVAGVRAGGDGQREHQGPAIG